MNKKTKIDLIKFRGQRIDSGKWVYGYYFKGREHSWILQQKAPHEVEKHGLEPFKPIEVIPESVGQYIEIKDKNGVEIYAGDIVSGYRGINRVIEKKNGCFGFKHCDDKNCNIFITANEKEYCDFKNDLEVVGNNYE